MSGSHITVSLDTDPVLRELSAMLATLRQPERALRDMGEALLLSTDNRFRSQVSPDGHPWAQLSDITLQRRLASRAGARTKKGAVSAKGRRVLAGAKILRDSGALQDTMAYQIQGDTLLVGTNRIYAAMQQFGGTRAQWPHLWGTIPARPFLGLSAADRAEIRAILKRHITRRA